MNYLLAAVAIIGGIVSWTLTVLFFVLRATFWITVTAACAWGIVQAVLWLVRSAGG